jgi:hypothetical protein
VLLVQLSIQVSVERWGCQLEAAQHGPENWQRGRQSLRLGRFCDVFNRVAKLHA